MAFSTICRARDQVREPGSDCLHSRICIIMHEEYLISRNNFKQWLFQLFCRARDQVRDPGWAVVGGPRAGAGPDRLCNFYRPDPALPLECQ